MLWTIPTTTCCRCGTGSGRSGWRTSRSLSPPGAGHAVFSMWSLLRPRAAGHFPASQRAAGPIPRQPQGTPAPAFLWPTPPPHHRMPCASLTGLLPIFTMFADPIVQPQLFKFIYSLFLALIPQMPTVPCVPKCQGGSEGVPGRQGGMGEGPGGEEGGGLTTNPGPRAQDWGRRGHARSQAPVGSCAGGLRVSLSLRVSFSHL